jgi:hypothetical protein
MTSHTTNHTFLKRPAHENKTRLKSQKSSRKLLNQTAKVNGSTKRSLNGDVGRFVDKNLNFLLCTFLYNAHEANFKCLNVSLLL